MGTWGWLPFLHRTRRNFAAKPRWIPPTAAAGAELRIVPAGERELDAGPWTQQWHVWEPCLDGWDFSNETHASTIVTEVRTSLEPAEISISTVRFAVGSSVWGSMECPVFHICFLAWLDWNFYLWWPLRSVKNVEFYFTLKKNPAVVWLRYISSSHHTQS